MATSEKITIMLPICSFCGSIRDAQGRWCRLDERAEEFFNLVYTHTFCQDCAKIFYPTFTGYPLSSPPECR